VPVPPGVDARGLDQQVGLAGWYGHQGFVDGDRLGVTLLVDEYAGLGEIAAEGGKAESQCGEQR